jgi:hypothetical protein
MKKEEHKKIAGSKEESSWGKAKIFGETKFITDNK